MNTEVWLEGSLPLSVVDIFASTISTRIQETIGLPQDYDDHVEVYM